jgi:hypothetical protein
MRPQPEVAAACDGKIRYAPSQAEQAIKAAARMRRAHHGAIRAYRCECCGGWHVGKPTGPPRRGLH